MKAFSEEARRWLWMVIAVVWFAVPGGPGTQAIGFSIAQILAAYAKYYSGMLQ